MPIHSSRDAGESNERLTAEISPKSFHPAVPSIDTLLRLPQQQKPNQKQQQQPMPFAAHASSTLHLQPFESKRCVLAARSSLFQSSRLNSSTTYLGDECLAL